jgi:hypothetical protein
MSPFGRATADVLSRHVPGWLAILNWALCPLLAALLMGPIDLPAYVWVPLYAVLLVSFAFFAVSFHFHPFISLSLLVFGYFEVYWLLPRWKAKWKYNHDLR